MRRRRRRRRHTGLWILVWSLVAIAAVTLFLIYRGAKVSGPDAEDSASSHIIDTTPTATHAQAGTYTASGAANDPDGEALSVRVYLRIQDNGHFRREQQIKGDSVRTIIDTGTYTGTTKSLKLDSTSAVIFTYHSAKAMRAQTPATTSRYGGSHASYPTYLTTVLNNRVTLKKGLAQTYHYVHKSLTLSTSIHAVPTIDAALSAQGGSTDTSSDSTSSQASSQSSQTNETPASTHSESHTKRDSASQSSATSSSDSSSSSSSDSSSDNLTVESAQAIVEQQYPSSDNTITAIGQSGDNFTFVVINKDTRDNQYVTVNADGELQ
ncbi:hypothetical protein [Lacticaseibacillus sp. GG6-2]